MSFSSVLPAFRVELDLLGLTEWTDAFNVENIPQTILDRSYHLEIGGITGNNANQTVHGFNFPVTVRVFLRGYQDTSQTRDEAMSLLDSILAELLKPAFRLGQVLKDVKPVSIDLSSLDGTNDNDMILTMVFSADLLCAFT